VKCSSVVINLIHFYVIILCYEIFYMKTFFYFINLSLIYEELILVLINFQIEDTMVSLEE